MEKRRLLSLLLSSSMILGMLPVSSASTADTNTQYQDTQGHWGESYINSWSGYGVVVGSNGNFRPDDSLTRGEMAVILNRVMEYELAANNNFSDLGQDFYTDSMLKANAAGVIAGNNGSINPSAAITREEAVVMLARTLNLDIDTQATTSTTFADDSSISYWAKDAVNQLVALGAITGKQGNYFAPKDSVTRAEVLTMLNGAIDFFVNESGSYSQDSKTVVVNTPDVTLKDMTITGDLILAEGIGDGDIHLDNVTVNGDIFIKGGGDNSIYFNNVSVDGDLTLARMANPVRLVVADNTSLSALNIASNAIVKVEDSTSEIQSVVVSAGEAVSLVGDFDVVVSTSPTVEISLDGSMAELQIQEGESVTLNGDFDNVTTATETLELTVAEGSVAALVVESGDAIKLVGDFQTVVSNTEVLDITVEGTLGELTVNKGESITVTGSVDTVVNNSSDLVLDVSGDVGEVQNTVAGTLNGESVEAGDTVTELPAVPESSTTEDDTADSDDDTTDSDDDTTDSDSSSSGSSSSGSSSSGSSSSGGGSSNTGGSTTTTPDTTPDPDPEPEVTPPVDPPVVPPVDPPVEPEVAPDGDSPDSPLYSNEDWTLLWSDEFNVKADTKTGVDETKWEFQIGTGSQYGLTDWGNGEEQYYTEENSEVVIGEDGNGVLVVTADNDTANNYSKDYTSSRLRTFGLFETTYGRFEASMSLPAVEGMWPAFWLLPTDSPYGGWAAGGEIDIMESQGGDTSHAGGTIHYGASWPNNTYSGNSFKYSEHEATKDKDATDFNEYAIEWEPGEIRWYVDGILFHTENSWYSTDSVDPNNFTFPAPFDVDFHIILNLAIGGWYDPDASLDGFVTNTMEVDYVRVWQKDPEYYEDMEEELANGLSEKADYDSTLGAGPAADGVVSHSFSQANIDTSTNHSTSQWNLHTQDGGTATVTDGGDGLVNLNISSAGTQTYSVQLIDYISMAKGRNYEVSFSAKADAARTMTSQFGSGEASGWTKYSNAFSSNLTTDWQTFTYAFTMESDQVADSRLEMNFGTNNTNIQIKDIVIKEVEEISASNAKAPLSNGNHVYNGTFDKGSYSLAEWDTTGTVSINDAKQASLATGAILSQTGLQQLEGYEYTVTFDATGSGTASFTNSDGTVESQAYTSGKNTLTFNASSADSMATLTFTATTASTIDNVQMLRAIKEDDIIRWVNYTPFDTEIAGYWDGYGNVWTNGTWSTWSGWDAGSGSGTMITNATGGRLVNDVQTVSTAEWNPLMEASFDFTGGMEYTVSFDMYSTVARDVKLVLGDSETTVSLTTSDKTHSYTFTPSGSGSVSQDVKFFMGAINGATESTIYLDNIKIYLSTEDGTNPPEMEPDDGTGDSGTGDSSGNLASFDGTFTNGQGDWQVFDDGGMEASFSAGVFTGSPTGTGSDFWSNQLYHVFDDLDKDANYVVSFDAWADKATAIQVIWQHESSWEWSDSINEIINLGTSAPAEPYTFTTAHGVWGDDSSAYTYKLGFFMGALAGATENATVHIDNVTVTKVGDPGGDTGGDNSGSTGDFATFNTQGQFSNASDLDSWAQLTDGGMTASVVNGELKVENVGNGAQDWSNFLKYAGISFEAGKTYTITFDAKADAATAIVLSMESGGRIIEPVISVGTTEETFNVKFTSTGTSADLVFLLGKVDGSTSTTVYIDDVKIEEGSIGETNTGTSGSGDDDTTTPPTEPTPPTTPDDDSELGDNLLTNGDFASGMNNWFAWGNSFDYKVENGVFIGDVKASSDTWDPHLKTDPDGILDHLNDNTVYTISFTAKADNARDIKLAFDNARDYFTEQTFSLTTEEQVFQYSFKLSIPVAPILLFSLGDVGNFATGNVFISDISIKEGGTITGGGSGDGSGDGSGGTVTPDESGNLVPNGTFNSNSTESWTAPTTGNMGSENGFLYFQTGGEAGSSLADQTVSNSGIVVETGTAYTFTSIVWGANREIGYKLSDSTGKTVKEGTITITASRPNTPVIDFDFTIPTGDHGNLKIEFFVGGMMDQAIYFDDVKIMAAGTDQSYTPDDNSILVNGNFKLGNMNNWYTEENGGAITSSVVADANSGYYFQGNVTSLGDTEWKPVLKYNNVPFDDSKNYVITFEAWTESAPRDIQFAIEQNGGSYTRTSTLDCGLTTTRQTFTVNYVPISGNTLDLNACFYLGNISGGTSATGIVNIANLKITETSKVATVEAETITIPATPLTPATVIVPEVEETTTIPATPLTPATVIVPEVEETTTIPATALTPATVTADITETENTED